MVESGGVGQETYLNLLLVIGVIVIYNRDVESLTNIRRTKYFWLRESGTPLVDGALEADFGFSTMAIVYIFGMYMCVRFES